MSLKILYIALECKPFSKVGGVGDVAGELPLALRQEGIDIEVVTPLYASVDLKDLVISHLDTFIFQFEGQKERAEIYTGLADKMPIHFIANQRYFEGVYGQPYVSSRYIPYIDDAVRFSFFSEACLYLINKRAPDIVHVNDWGLGFLLGRMVQRQMSQQRVITVHNIGYQGNIGQQAIRNREIETFLTDDKTRTSFLDPRKEWSSINPLKMGLQLCHMANTVSPSYCLEITRPEDKKSFFPGGQGLEKTTKELWQQDRLLGILNGFEYSLEPTEEQFSDLLQKKAECKKKTVSHFFHQDGLVLGFVGRAVEQKCRLLTETLDNKNIIEHILDIPGVNIAVLAQGDPDYENFFLKYSQNKNFWVRIGFDPELAALIQLGCDVFLMPSLFEPCGIAQMASMARATPALVRWTGGLIDTVIPYTSANGNGFGFNGSSREEILTDFLQAVHDISNLYQNNPQALIPIQKNAFYQRFLWSDTAQKYIQMYMKADMD